ncbi:MAG: hypothetical protein Q7O66_00840, partial [Dehalococcoidia bacterium]|nr:hypothetical protein [Dehalococcoidia bacterium]
RKLHNERTIMANTLADTTTTLVIYLDREQRAQLSAYAERRGMSMSKCAGKLLRFAMAISRPQLEEFTRRARPSAEGDQADLSTLWREIFGLPLGIIEETEP